MATARLALSSVLDTVSSAASSVGSIFNTATKSVGMLDAFVTKASEEQRLRHKAQRMTYIDNLINESAEQQALTQVRIEEFCSKSASHQAYFKNAHDRFQQLFADEAVDTKPSE